MRVARVRIIFLHFICRNLMSFDKTPRKYFTIGNIVLSIHYYIYLFIVFVTIYYVILITLY